MESEYFSYMMNYGLAAALKGKIPTELDQGPLCSALCFQEESERGLWNLSKGSKYNKASPVSGINWC